MRRLLLSKKGSHQRILRKETRRPRHPNFLQMFDLSFESFKSSKSSSQGIRVSNVFPSGKRSTAHWMTELLRSYRIAHARVSAIEHFETLLRENTPLASINDPAALVEYLNQLNLKGDMVLDELKRVSSERDNFKQKLAEAEKSAREAWDNVTALREPNPIEGDVNERPNSTEAPTSNGAIEPPTEGTAPQDSSKGEPSEITAKSPPTPAKSRTSSIPSISLFSPKAKAIQEPKVDEQAEEFFSYDSELPKLQHELKESQAQVTELQEEVKAIKGDLAVARESTQSMVKTLEDSTREMNLLKERGDKCEVDLTEQKNTAEDTIRSLKEDLQVANGRLKDVETQQSAQITEHISGLEERLQDAKSELDAMHKKDAEESNSAATIERLQREIKALEAEVSMVRSQKDLSQKRVETLNGLVSNLREQLSKAEDNEKQLKSELNDNMATVNALQDRITLTENSTSPKGENAIEINGIGNKSGSLTPGEGRNMDTGATGDGTSTAKKKHKKKKKGGKAAAEADNLTHLDSPTSVGIGQDPTPDTPAHLLQNDTVSRLQQELDHLGSLLEEKDAAIERLHGKLKNGEDMQEEIDSLRDDLVLVGQDHVRARDQIKDLISEKSALQTTATNLENEIADLRATHASNAADSKQAQRDLATQFEDLKVKATTLETDLSIAQQLASSRFKDVTDLKNILQKVQPQLAALKNEVTEVTKVKEELKTKSIALGQIEAKHETIQAELDHMKKVIADKDSEIKLLNHKSRQDVIDKSRAEEAIKKSSQELQQSENENLHLGQSLDRVSKDLNKYQEDLRVSKAQLRKLEESITKLTRDNDELKEELELKTAQYASAESLMSSMRDQSTEMAMQAKEARERCDNLEEEVADAHRLLGERSREGETMRRLLAEVEGRTESRIREMKERMDTAVEERDRAEDEASTIGRRRARELEEVKNKLKDVERSLRRSEEDKEELEAAQRDWKRRREELEQRAEQASHEAEEVRRAMSELRDALDESERQARELEKQKVELLQSVEDTQNRLDRLQKSNKVRQNQSSLFFGQIVDTNMS